ncbi:SbcC/MukB-like Walker B domain-containing protein [Aureimonas sp. AU22]|uniref:SbcC/MukB-like Walker B domain-containing protein n=1 Tax=Aureimonas sp. AU22 TaxID=1638162 RepID=UPI0007863DFC|nr:SbcC/MukB-like Walker B domain-containing protein [Aureimonas sp. AU22]
MYSLRRISLSNWYLIDAKDIDIRGEAALIGPTGAGKTSIQDAIQTVITGASQNRLNLNASASGRSSRSVLEYCLGMTGDPAENGRPLRQSCETLLVLTFANDQTGEPIAVGIAMAARHGEAREEILSRFIAPGHAFSLEAVRKSEGGVETVKPWADIARDLRESCPAFSEYKASAEKFTAEMLTAMRGPASAPNARHFLRAFSNALAFRPIFDPTVFVRDFVLEPDPLDVERVRASIATWRELEGLIEEAEAKHRHVSRISAKFLGWGRERLAGDLGRWRAGALQARRTGQEALSIRRALREREAELALEQGVLSTRREWIRSWDEEIRDKSARLAAAGGEGRLREIAAETRHNERDIREIEQGWGRIATGLGTLARLVLRHAGDLPAGAVEAGRAAAEALTLVRDGDSFLDHARGKGDRLEDLLATARRADGFEAALDAATERLGARAHALEGELERLRGALSRPKGAGGVLSREASRLLAQLQAAGIPAVPLCDLVDIVDPSWQYAAEALLGRGREALIVEPARLSQAFDLMWRDRNAFAGCTLVKTSATRGINARAPVGSILEALATDDPHARAFLAVRIGAFRKAETDAELDRLERGVMRNGKTSSGMGLSVQRDLGDLLFGRSGSLNEGAGLEAERARLEAELAEARARLREAREGARALGPVLAALSPEAGPAELERRAMGVRQRGDELLRDRRALEEGEAATLKAEIEDIRGERDAYATELAEEVEPKVEALRQTVANLKARGDMAAERHRAAHTRRRRAWGILATEATTELLSLTRVGDEAPRTLAAECAALRAEIAAAEAERRDAAAWLASARNEAEQAAEAAEGAARRDQLSALRELTEYAGRWSAPVPAFDGETMASALAWVLAEASRLETHELRGHRDACIKAAAEMRRMMREDLLARLSEKLARVGYRLAGINRLLKRHRFTGQTYAFSYAVNGRFEGMHDLARRAVEGQLTDEAFDTSMSEVEAMIEGAEDAALLADYRQYYTFEIVMSDADGNRTTLSSRAMKGSGGEAQVPFYVAIAASLALAYFPGHIAGRPVGMGLALFDEAFNKLDVPNTQALLRFFRDMGLQLLIAGPEDKRATFTEVLDTIILVNKSLDGRAVYIDTEYPGETAKQALARLNPDHKGVEGFRSAAE